MAAPRTGRCLCGAITFECGEPVFTAICHCEDCAKISTAPVHQIPVDAFKITSTAQPKEFTMKSDFDRDITSHFCPSCGTTLYRTGGAPQVAGLVGLRTGCLDDQTALRATAPGMEVFVHRRPRWRNPLMEAVWLDGQYEVVEKEGGKEAVAVN